MLSNKSLLGIGVLLHSTPTRELGRSTGSTAVLMMRENVAVRKCTESRCILLAQIVKANRGLMLTALGVQAAMYHHIRGTASGALHPPELDHGTSRGFIDCDKKALEKGLKDQLQI